MLSQFDQNMVEIDLANASEYFERLYGVEFSVDFVYREEYLVIANFPLPKGFSKPTIPLLLPLSGFPIKPPPGLHVPTQAPDTPRLASSYSVFKDGPAPYARTHNLTQQGWAWLCLRKKTALGDGWDWNYQYTTKGQDSLKNFLVIFDANNREAVPS